MHGDPRRWVACSNARELRINLGGLSVAVSGTLTPGGAAGVFVQRIDDQRAIEAELQRERVDDAFAIGL